MIAELQVQLVMRGFYSPAGAAEEEPEVKIVQLTAEDALKLEDQVMVEASMKQLQADLHEARSRNIYLNDLVEEQKRYHRNSSLLLLHFHSVKP